MNWQVIERGAVEVFKIASLTPLPAKKGAGGKKVPLMWNASMVPVTNELAMLNTRIKAWPGPDSAGVRVGNIVRAQRVVQAPSDGGRAWEYYEVVSLKAAKSIEEKKRLEERLGTMERRIAHLEEFMKRLLRDRTEASERRLGGNPDARREGKGEGPSEEYLRTMADPERKMPLVPSGSLA